MSKSSQVAPPAARAIRVSASTSTCRIDREVDHEAVVADAMPSGIVPTTANRDLQSVLACELERRGHVVAAETARDHRGPASDERVEPAARVFVAVVARRDDRA